MSRKVESQYDVIVAGGGAGGVGAALGAARSGAKVCLLEKYGFLGGVATHSQVLAYCGFYQQGSEPIQAVGGAGQLVLDEMSKVGTDIEPFRSPTTGNWIVVLEPESVKLALDRILDATGDANLSLVAGISIQTGNEKGYFNAASAPIRIGGLDAKMQIDREAIIQALSLYSRAGKYPVLRKDGGIYTRMPGSGDMWWMVIDLPMSDLSSQSFSVAERNMRAAAHDYLGVIKSSVPGFENAYLVQTGPQIGIRESRHPKARYRLTRDDLLSGKAREDGVARAAWPAEIHTETGNPTYHSIGGNGYAHIPLDSLRASELDNLYFAGRIIGADDIAFGSVRVMGTAFASGEAAGVAAANPNFNDLRVRETIISLGGIV